MSDLSDTSAIAVEANEMMSGFYMRQRCGAWQIGSDPNHGAVEFKIFFPDPDRDPSQFGGKLGDRRRNQPTYGHPRITSIRVAGSFQEHLGQQNWDFNAGPELTRHPISEGWIWTYHTPMDLPSGFYEYKYRVTFEDGRQRIVGDPCTRYGGREHQNSAFVIGGSCLSDNPIMPISGGRQHLRDQVVYELMIDDFTDEYREGLAPLEAVQQRLDHIEELGANAILFMPWTAWPHAGFNWGYIPHQYFSVEYRYANAINQPAEKLSKLKSLINECHRRGIHVIMDGVFNHVGDMDEDEGVANGFPYRWFYQDTRDCPYVGEFGGTFPGLLDLDYHNPCTQQFIRDACFYWMDQFCIDGIRFDNTVNFYDPPESPKGLPQLIDDIHTHAVDPNFSTTLEHIDISAAAVTRDVDATSYWNNAFYERMFDYLWTGRIDQRLLRAINSHEGLNANQVATTYLGNHDHSHIAYRAGERAYQGAAYWYRIQPYAIAMFTSPGAPMIHNGQEFAEEHRLMEDDHGTGRRVKPRPLRWGFKNDSFGRPTFNLFAKLSHMRRQFPGLRSDNVYPATWETWQTQFNPAGYGIDVARQLVIYHRWGATDDGRLQRFMIVLNFSPNNQTVDVPFTENGVWTDLLNDQQVNVEGNRLQNVEVGSNWGRVFYQ
jgi:1,4-alpha-glucan branching enzyme